MIKMLAFRNIGIKAIKSNQFLSRSIIGFRANSTLTNASQKHAKYEPTKEELELANKLTWEEFLALRKQQNRLGLVGSVSAALLSMSGAFSYFSTIEIDPTETLFGLDIFTVYIGAILSTGVLGFVVGPSIIGDSLFAIMNRNIMKNFNVKQKLFLKHIAKMRVDASRQSMNNPVPDYYGENITSLKDYRQWLRDCNEYRRKAKQFL